MSRFEEALRRFDAANAQDPVKELVSGQPTPKELIYGQRMSEALQRFAPDAPEAVRLAARSQHIRRWEIPRSSYPEGRVGYLKWRVELYSFHAECAAAILRDVGYDEPTIERVRHLLRKRQLKHDPDTQLLEDVICLVFLQHYFHDFAAKHDTDKLIDIVRKTWRKMSDAGHAAALQLQYSEQDLALITKALSA